MVTIRGSANKCPNVFGTSEEHLYIGHMGGHLDKMIQERVGMIRIETI